MALGEANRDRFQENILLRQKIQSFVGTRRTWGAHLQKQFDAAKTPGVRCGGVAPSHRSGSEDDYNQGTTGANTSHLPFLF
jgi:hypothetical protein